MFSKSNACWKSLYFIPVLLVYLIIGINTYTVTIYYSFEFPLKITLVKIVLSIIFYFCAFMTIITHTLSMVTNPGFVNQEKLKTEKLKNKIDQLPYCKKCEAPRPFKCHHCSTCQTCILKMDHHCPWIANCVGFANQKYFYQFLFYASLGDLAGAIGLFSKIIHPSFSTLLNKPSRKINLNNNLFLEILSVLKEPLLIILGFGLCIAMAIAIGCLFFYQTYLILNDSSTIDNKVNQHKCKIEKIKNIENSNKDENFKINRENKNLQTTKNKRSKLDLFIKKDENKCTNNDVDKLNYEVSKNEQNPNKNCEQNNCNKEKEKIGFFRSIMNTLKRDNIRNIQVIMGESLFEWFIPTFTANEFNNGYNYSNTDI